MPENGTLYTAYGHKVEFFFCHCDPPFGGEAIRLVLGIMGLLRFSASWRIRSQRPKSSIYARAKCNITGLNSGS